MSSLVQFDNYGAMNTTDSTTMGYYENIVFSEDYTLQEETTYGRKTYTASKLVVKAQ